MHFMEPSSKSSPMSPSQVVDDIMMSPGSSSTTECGIVVDIHSMSETCNIVIEELAIIAEDGAEYGCISEDSYCETAPVRRSPKYPPLRSDRVHFAKACRRKS